MFVRVVPAVVVPVAPVGVVNTDAVGAVELVGRARHCVREEGRKEMFYLTTHSTHFYLRLYGRKEGNVLFNDTLNTFLFTVIWKEVRKCFI